jgi:cobalamin biosynthesis Mg chelatase CobN
MNESIKNAIIKHLEKKNVITESFYSELTEETKKIKYLRDKIDTSLLDIKKEIIKTNFHILIEKIFKEDKESVINILKNTKNRINFYDVIEEIGKLLVSFEQYNENYEFNSPELTTLKETFALKDNQLYELINEINLDKK